jgi:hypothetical protein
MKGAFSTPRRQANHGNATSPWSQPRQCHIVVLAVAASMRTSACQRVFERGADSGRLTCQPAAPALSPPD